MKKKDIILLVIIMLLAGALLYTIYTIRETKRSRIADAHVEILSSVDEYIAEGYHDKTEETMLRLARIDVSAATYLQLLKRRHTLTQKNDDYTLMVEIAKEGYAEFPAREDLSMLLAYGYLRSGDKKRAVEIAEKSDITSPRWAAVQAELSVAQGTFFREPSGERGDTEDSRSLYRRVIDSDDPELLEQAWEETGAESFLLDAVLLHLYSGNPYRAWELFRKIGGNKFPKLRFYLAYDTEQWRLAEELLAAVPAGSDPNELSRVEKIMLRGDIALEIGENERAAELYREVLREDPDYSWNAMYNLAYIRYSHPEKRGMDKEFMEKIRSAGEGRPKQIIEMAELLLAFHDSQAAEALLAEGYAERGDTREGTSEELLLLKEKTKKRINPERYKALLRMLVNRSGGEKYASHLAWFLLGVEDYSSLRELLSYYSQRYGETSWLLFYRGVLEAERKEYESALSSFSLSLERDVHWQTYYNMALVTALNSEATRAISLLGEALEVCGDDSTAKAEILSRRGEIKYRNGRESAAYADAERALSLDPSNATAQLILNTLEPSQTQ